MEETTRIGTTSGKDSSGQEQQIRAPTINLPKGGGAIKGIGEKFGVNPVNGSASLTIPIFTSPGRSGFGPQLSLSYDSGAGNGPFGFGWSLTIPKITRKTDKGLPRYRDNEESDVFILSDAEDLVPVLLFDEHGQPVKHLSGNWAGQSYSVYRYRPRIEGLFARIERWRDEQTGETHHWRAITRDNITSIYGGSSDSRIFDPDDPNPEAPTRVFSWLLARTYDDKGNLIVYEYAAENSANVSLELHEKNRKFIANRYLKRISYGYQRPYFSAENPQLPDPQKEAHFQVVFDYGEHDRDNPQCHDDLTHDWKPRPDPISSFRAGFEVRTYRRCHRVLMFHCFPELGNAPCLVRSTDFSYQKLGEESQPEPESSLVASYIRYVTQSGYVRNGEGYTKRSYPPVEFEYSEVKIDERVQTVESHSVENLPSGLDGGRYQWVDLDGEGLSGILTEQADAWWYKRNLSPIAVEKDENGNPRVVARFAPAEIVRSQPSLANLSGGHQQLLDLAGDGQVDLVELDRPVPGFYERTDDAGWESFKAFSSCPDLTWSDPNLKFVDLTGDGHADVLVTEDQVLTWYPSLAEDGFGPGEKARQALDEEKGPRLIFADGTQSVYLADMSGDGLTDLVRIRNGEVCYRPNLGFGRFGAKITMSNSPQFDNPDQFDQKRIRIADIDGSGNTDLIYLHRDGIRVYFNRSGNSWSPAQEIKYFPAVDNLAAVTALDLLGNGTACLVWSSPLSGDARRPMRYIDLMGGNKPHLLTRVRNNLGAETAVEYAPSTKFYRADEATGKPWVTKLPFPVHCVEKVTVTDKWRQTAFTTTYSYHHGYFDGFEREFRGFGRVDQVDSESFGKFQSANPNSPYITPDQTLYQPPVKTVTWYHTGALLQLDRILSHFEHEYFPCGFEGKIEDSFQENTLPPPDLEAQNLSADEWREALRACKGMMLRQEIYELDVDELEKGKQIPVKLFTTAYHNCHIQCLQPKGSNKHAVFLVAESEAITYHYELDLRADKVTPDPRIAHALNLKIDEYAHVLQSVTAVYPRKRSFKDDVSLAKGLEDALPLIDQVQKPKEPHLAYTETRYTKDYPEEPAEFEKVTDNYRLRVPCEVLTYELTGISPTDTGDLATPDPRDDRYFAIDELRRLWLSPVHQKTGDPVDELLYHEIADPGNDPTTNLPKKQKRLIEHARTLFFAEDLINPFPLGRQGRLGLTYENYKLALTDDLLDAVFHDLAGNKLDKLFDDRTPRDSLNDPDISGYLSGTNLSQRFPNTETKGQYWIRSGIAGFDPDAPQHFYLPERYTDPFGNVTKITYGPIDPHTHESTYLFVQSNTDALGNTTQVNRFDYRVLAPSEMQDMNGNLSEVYFDGLGLPCAMALKGNGSEGDHLENFDDTLANPGMDALRAFFNSPTYDENQARIWLDSATARHNYYFGEMIEDGKTVWGQHPACACGILRETHVSQLAPNQNSRLQASFEYSDGMGSVVVKKIQAEPEKTGQPMRWIANGKTILNNKGKPVKQYEPYFSSSGHKFEEPKEEGVTPVIYYDAVGRTVRTETPDGCFSRVEFSPWHVQILDPNDTAFDPDPAKRSDWYDRRMNPLNPQFTEFNTPENVRAAKSVEPHSNTPALTILDSLGRNVIAIVHNRVEDAQGTLEFGGKHYKDEYYLTYTKLDAEGKPLWIRDARKNLVMQYITPPKPTRLDDTPPNPNELTDITREYIPLGSVPCYDIAGNLLFQHSMDAGDRWMLNDAAGKPMIAWDSRGHTFRTEYDALHRPVASFVKGAEPSQPEQVLQFEKTIYGDTPNNGLSDDQKTKLNLRGKPYQHYDTAGLITSLVRNPVIGEDEAYDFKGNLLRSQRRLIKDYKNTADWSQDAESQLESETFMGSTHYDALNRPIQMVAPHSNQPDTKLNSIQPGYNEANLLERVDVWLGQANEPDTLLVPTPATAKVKNIDYNAKGQRTLVQYGNGATTTYDYDPLTFRLAHLQTMRGTDALQNLFYTYDPVGNITAIRDDSQDRIFHSNQCVKPGSDYEYDALYRLMAATGREHRGENQQVGWDDSVRFEYTLPNDGHALRNYLETYLYDEVGNIQEMKHTEAAAIDQPGSTIWRRCYQYATDSNRLIATSIASDPKDKPGYVDAADLNHKYTDRYDYDAHGNMKVMPHLPVMVWDFKDQLQASTRQILNPSPPPDNIPETTYYVYDSAGQRVRKVTVGQNGKRQKDRIYLGGFEIYREYNGDETTKKCERETLHIMDDKRPVALVETKTVDASTNADLNTPVIRYQLDNHLGSVYLELDDKANVISYEEYHPYGSTAYSAGRSQAEVSLKRYRYTGKERDEETGLYYYGARYYPSWLGRWANVDPFGVTAPGKGDLNFYSYVRGNVITAIDPVGMDWWQGSQGSGPAQPPEPPPTDPVMPKKSEGSRSGSPSNPGPDVGAQGSGSGSGSPEDTPEARERQRLNQINQVKEQAKKDADAFFESILKARYLNAIHWRDFRHGSFAEGISSYLRAQGESGSIGIPARPEDTSNVQWIDESWHPKLQLDDRLVSDDLYRRTFLLSFDERVARYQFNLENPVLEAGIGSKRRVLPYGKSRKQPGGQSHHLNQDAVFRSVVPTRAGPAIKLTGNAFTEPNSPHYKFHASLEEFWDKYRSGGTSAGQLPTAQQYNQALKSALLNAGVEHELAKFYANVAKRHLSLFYGIRPTDPIPNIPGRLNQRK